MVVDDQPMWELAEDYYRFVNCREIAIFPFCQGISSSPYCSILACHIPEKKVKGLVTIC